MFSLQEEMSKLKLFDKGVFIEQSGLPVVGIADLRMALKKNVVQ